MERNYMKYFNNSTCDDTYDDKIKDKINDIRMILSRLGNIVTKNDRKEIKKELYEIEKKQNLSDNEKEEVYDHLVELVNTLNKKEEHKHIDRDDLDYFEIRELENLFGDIDKDDNYCKPVLEVPLKIVINNMKAEKIKDKKIISKAISLHNYAILSRFNK